MLFGRHDITKDTDIADNQIQFLLYSMPDDEGKVNVVIKDETLWCSQKAMAQLFGCSADNIGLHLKNIILSTPSLLSVIVTP